MVTKSPLVSIIVPNYNHEKYLKQRLKSIFNQTYTYFEVILLDDCSTDNSRNILEEYSKYPQVTNCIFNKVNSGNTFKQWNKGISLAKGDYVWIAETDDFCEVNFLEEMMKAMLNNDCLKMVYCQSNKVNENNVITGDWKDFTNEFESVLFSSNFILSGNKFIEKFLIYKNVIPNVSGVLFRNEGVFKRGLTDEISSLKYSGDWLFYITIIANNKIGFIKEKLNNFRFHSNSVIAKVKINNDRISIINLDLAFRKKAIAIISKLEISNYSKILSINNGIRKGLIYEKVLIHFKNNRKLKGVILLTSVLDVFVKNYNFKKWIINRDKFQNRT